MSNGDKRLENDIERVISKVEQQGQTTERLGSKTGRQSLETPLVEIPELVNNWVRIGDLSLLVGFGGIGKSTVALNLSLALAGGTDFVGYAVNRPEHVLYLDLEMGEYEFRTRLNMLLPQYPEVARDNFRWVSLPTFRMGGNRVLETKLRNELTAIRPKLLVVDNHARFHSGDANSEGDMMPMVIVPLTELMAEFGLGVLYLMHTPWGEQDRPRGTVCVYDAASTVVAIKKSPEAPTVRLLKWTKRRSARRRMGALEVEVGYNADTYMVYPSAHAAIYAILSELTFPATKAVIAKAISDGLGVTERQGYNKIRELLEQGVLVGDRSRGGKLELGRPRIFDFVALR